MRVRAVRVEFQRTPELALGRVPVPVVPEDDMAEGGVGLGQPVVDLDRLPRRGLRLRHQFRRRHFTGDCEHAVCLGEPGVGQRVSRVNLDRLPEVGDAGLNLRPCVFEKVVMTLEVKLVGFGVPRVILREALLVGAREPRPQLQRNVPRDLAL